MSKWLCIGCGTKIKNHCTDLGCRVCRDRYFIEYLSRAMAYEHKMNTQREKEDAK
jgi:hypothetical protein